jgi:hypothetical protein
MAKRQQYRDAAEAVAGDKMVNPLIAVPGSPGIGKSTFLCNFPLSDAYKTYAGPNAIVSTLSFNKGMSTFHGEKDTLGLRIVYGAAVSMGLLEANPAAWLDFGEQFPLHDVTAAAAVRILQRVFGANSRVLILVDELSKAKDAKECMSQLGEVSAIFGHCDVVVSALSPNYVLELLKSSQRPVRYVVLPPLLDTDLGRKECHEWADRLIGQFGDTNINTYKQNMLRNVYLLCSGHPRSLEKMVNILNDVKVDWSNVEGALTTESESPLMVLQAVIDNLRNCILDIESLPESDMETYVFTTLSEWSAEHAGVQRLIESGKLMVYDQVNTEFIISVQAFALADLILTAAVKKKQHWKAYNSVNTRAARILLSNLRHGNVGQLWERIVLFTVLSRSYYGATLQEMFGLQTGVPGDRRTWNRCLDIHIDNPELSSNASPRGRGNVVMVPQSGQDTGFDGLVLLKDELPSSWYLQMKISRPSTPVVDVLASMVSYCLRDHSARGASMALDQVHMVLYVWNNMEEEQKSVGGIKWRNVSPATISARIQQMFNSSSGPMKSLRCDGFNEGYVIIYVTNHWQNIHIVGEDGLRKWLPASFLPFPILFTRVEDGDN